MEFAVRREIIFLFSKCSKEKRYPIPGTRVVAVEIGDYARLDLQLGGTDIVYLLILDIFVLEVDTRGGWQAE